MFFVLFFFSLWSEGLFDFVLNICIVVLTFLYEWSDVNNSLHFVKHQPQILMREVLVIMYCDILSLFSGWSSKHFVNLKLECKKDFQSEVIPVSCSVIAYPNFQID